MLSILTNSTFVQRLLSQSSNIGAVVRGDYRIATVIPEDRKADYTFRDVILYMAVPFQQEAGFRLAQKLYLFPQITQALELNRLAQLYQGDPRFKDIPVRNYKSIAEIPELRKALSGSIVRSSSIHMVPEVFEKVDAARLGQYAAEDAAQTPVLVNHLKRRLNFPQYLEALVAEKAISPEQVSQVNRVLDTLGFTKKIVGDVPEKILYSDSFKALARNLGNVETPLEEEAAKILVRLMGGTEENVASMTSGKHLGRFVESGIYTGSLKGRYVGKVHETLRDLLAVIEKGATSVEKTEQGLIEHYASKYGTQVKELVEDALKSKTVLSTIAKYQSRSFWPKMIPGILLTLGGWGMLASYLDVKWVQPWQEKITKEGISSSIVLWPAHLAIIPAALAGFWTMGSEVLNIQGSKLFRKMDPLWQFAVATVVTSVAYAAAYFGLTQARLTAAHAKLKSGDGANNPAFRLGNNMPPRVPPKALAPLTSHPSLFRRFETQG